MKYFTPDLLDRYGSQDDDIADQAENEWELATKEYLAYFEEIKDKFPKDFKRLQTHFYLHDARILFLDYIDRFFLMRLELNGGTNLALAYELSNRSPIHFTLPDKKLFWLYDEVQLKQGGNNPIFLHSFLFTNTEDQTGEIKIEFANFILEEIQSEEDFQVFLAKRDLNWSSTNGELQTGLGLSGPLPV